MRVGTVAASTLLVVAGLAGGARSAAAAPPCAITSAVGVAAAPVGGQAAAGVVEYRSQCTGAVQLTLPTPRAGDRFGSSVAVADVNHDGYDDLLVGTPGHDVGSAADAGGVAVFTGSATGPVFDTVLVAGDAGVPGTVQAGARFGTAVSAAIAFGDDSDDGYVRVLVGEPGEDVDGAHDAGGFDTVIYRHGAISSAESTHTTLASPGVAGSPQAGDLLGSAVDTLPGTIVGAPGREVAGHPGAGAVLLGDTLLTQNSPCLPGVAETGDHFGAAVAGDWVGVPGEDLGTAVDAGLVERVVPVPTGRSTTCIGLDQAVPGMSGTPETGDRFGAALVELHGYEDDTTYYPEALLIGVPGEDTGTHRDSGFVNVVRESFDPDDQGAGTAVGDGSTAGPNRTGAAYGSSFGLAQGASVQVGAPGGTGLVYGVHYQHGQPLHHDSTVTPAGAYPSGSFGLVLAGSDY